MIQDITIEDLKSCPWREIVNKASQKDCLDYSLLFLEESSKYDEKIAIKNACLLLCRICSICLSHDDKEIFKPIYSNSQDRTMLPQDLPEQYIDVLYKFLSEIDDSELKARIADLIWLKKDKYKIESAHIAIDEYIKSFEVLKLNNEYDAVLRLHRAIYLSYEIQSNDAQQKVVKIVEEYVINTKEELIGIPHYELLKILCKRRLGDQKKLSEKCKRIAFYYENIKCYHFMRDILKIYCKFMKNLDTDFDMKDIQIKEAESYVLEANNTSSAMTKTIFLEKAIKTFKSIQNFKNFPDISNRIDELHAQLIKEQRDIPNELTIIKSSEIDITQLMKEAESLVSGLNLCDALSNLSEIIDMPNEKELRKKSLKIITNNPLSYIFSQKFINEKGKTIGNVSLKEINNLSPNDNIVTADIFRQLNIVLNINVEARILPAIDKIRSERSIILCDLIPFLENNIFVPQGYEKLYARGLLAGFNKDFVTAALFLVPQLENSIRNVLEYYGHVITSNLTSSGAQKEKDLNVLLSNENVIQIFGKDDIFMLRYVMTENLGENFRNLLAHGLRTYEQLQNQTSIFSWWLVLRLVMKSFNGSYNADNLTDD